MAREYFLACDETGLSLFASKPRLREYFSPHMWIWVDEDGSYGLPLMGGDNLTKKFRKVPINSYIKLIDFGEDGLFYPLRKTEIK